jgi:hypothetical protein
VLVDGEALPGFTPGARHGELVLPSAMNGDFSPGTQHIVTVIPFLFESDCALYRGCYVESDPCTLSCDPVDCNAPVLLELAQTRYGETVTVDATWRNGEDPLYPGDAADGSDGIFGFFEDMENPLGALPGDAQGAVFELPGAAPGDVNFGIQGNCGQPFGSSSILEQTFTILEESPHTSPIEGEIECEYDFTANPATGTATWTSADPSCFIDVFVYAPPAAPGGEEQIFFVTTIHGGEETITLNGFQSEEERIGLQFFTRVDGVAYGSEVLFCDDGDEVGTFIRGPCGTPDQADPQITNAVTIFGYLFQGQGVPPCLEACDVDGIPPVNITDGIYLLRFLFSGGPPPPGWVDRDDDGIADPTCEEITPEMDCQSPATVCPLE